MELLFLILLFIFVSAMRNKNKAQKKGAPGAAAPTVEPASAPEPAEKAADGKRPSSAELRRLREQLLAARAAARAAGGPASEPGMNTAELRRLRERLLAARAANASTTAAQAAPAAGEAAAAFAQGASALDEEGCVGGSMAHVHTEGEDYAEHARHKEEVKRREAIEALEQARAADVAALNVRRLRQAVVMAEVLNRPKALRAPGRGGRPA